MPVIGQIYSFPVKVPHHGRLKKGFLLFFLSVAMPPSDISTANIDEVLHELTTDEAILLTAGVGFWYTHSVERLGIPAIKVFVLRIRPPFLAWSINHFFL